MVYGTITGQRYSSRDFGDVYLRYIGNDVYVDVFSILRIVGDRAVQYLQEYFGDICWGFEGKKLLYAPSDVVFKSVNDFMDDIENSEDEAEEAQFAVANKFGKFVYLHRIMAYYKDMHKKKTGHDYDLDKKKYSLQDVLDILNTLRLDIKKPITFMY